MDYLTEVSTCSDFSDHNCLVSSYADFMKAFEKDHHHLLVEKLCSLGVHGSGLKLLESYHIGRHQTVRIANTTSRLLEVHSGGPQGSLLVPLRCLVFINDLPDRVMSKSSGYAVDFKNVGSNSNILGIHVKKIGNGVKKI